MILVDFNNKASITYSSVMKMSFEEHIKIFKNNKKQGLDLAPEFTVKDYNKHFKGFCNIMLKDFYTIQKKYSNYGDLCICVDYDRKNYWRKELQKTYKSNRENQKKNDFDKKANKYFHEHLNSFIELLKNMGVMVVDEVSLPFNNNPQASVEADDIVSVLTEVPEKHLIVSNDGDYKQLLTNPKVKIYNPFERKIVEATKKEINEKNLESLLLGQAKDNIFSIKYNSEICPKFIKWMKEKYDVEITPDMIYKLNTKYKKYSDEYKEEMNKLDEKEIKEGKRKKRRNLTPFAKPNFGESNYKKLIAAYSIDEILEMNPIYKMRYELNKKLYYFNEIPQAVKKAIFKKYKEVKNNPNRNTYKAQSFCTMKGIQYVELGRNQNKLF